MQATARSIDYFDDGDSVDIELYDDSTALAAPMQALTLGAHTIGTANVQLRLGQSQESSKVPADVRVQTLEAQLAAAQAVCFINDIELSVLFTTFCFRHFASASSKSQARSPRRKCCMSSCLMPTSRSETDVRLSSLTSLILSLMD